MTLVRQNSSLVWILCQWRTQGGF